MFVYLLILCWVLCIWKKAATSSSVIQGNIFINLLVYRFWGASETFGGYATSLGLRRDLPTKGLPILFQELMVSLWCLSAVLQALWCCSPKSHHCPFFSLAPRHPKYITFPISTPIQAKHKPVSCVATQKAGTPDTHSSPSSQEWSLQGHLVLTAEPHQSLQALWGQTMSVPLTLRVRGEEPVIRTPLRKLELWVNLPLSSFPYCLWWGNSRG